MALAKRRRRYPLEEKLAILEAAAEPSASVSEVSRRFGVGRGVIHKQALRGIAVGRHNWTFAGSDQGGRRAAAIYILIETAKLNDVDPQAWLADVLARIADHPASRLDEFLPWNWRPSHAGLSAAA